MAKIKLDLTIPDTADAGAVGDVLTTIVDSAYRAADWCDGLDWRITQIHNGEILMRTPLKPAGEA